jgi:adenylate cyclase, class 2
MLGLLPEPALSVRYTLRRPRCRAGRSVQLYYPAVADARLEIEIKLRAASAAAVRRLLRRLRARKLGRVHEMNILFDTADGALGRAGSILRVRRLRRLGRKVKGKGAAAMLTYKGVAEGGRYKVRKEIEGVFEPSGPVESILAALGYRPWFRYEKYRSSFRLPRLADLSVELDETPIGTFIELEGSRQAIDLAARRLGYGPADYVTASYYELFRRERGAWSFEPAEMVFSARNLPNSPSLSLPKPPPASTKG